MRSPSRLTDLLHFDMQTDLCSACSYLESSKSVNYIYSIYNGRNGGIVFLDICLVSSSTKTW